MIDFDLLTNQGGRDNNEDSVGMLENNGEYCFVVADGLGGHGFGEIASGIAVKTILESFVEHGLSGDCLGEAIQNTQNYVLEMQTQNHDYCDMKTTLVVLHIYSDMIRFAHVGDSRLYYFYGGKLKCRTLDHSVPQMLVLSGEIKEKEIRHHADRNRLLRVIGSAWNGPKYEISDEIQLKFKKRNAFLLCTDGFWELIDEKNMMKFLKQAKSCAEWNKLMQDYIVQNGKNTEMDNYSAIAIWIE